MSLDAEDSRSSSSTSPAPPDNEEESDFFLHNNDSQSSIGVPNVQDMVIGDAPWPPVHTLPNEILIQIFTKLSTNPSHLWACMLTCKRWARNAVDLLWHRPACNNWKNHSNICQTLALDNPFFRYRHFIRRLNLATLADKVNDGSVLPLAVCSRVERLTLTNCKALTDSGLIALIQGSSSLLALDISNDKHITEISINAIARHCSRLQGLNVSGCENITNKSMVNLAQSCKYIKRLKLNECSQLRDEAILAFANHCPNILEIDLQQCIHVGNGPITSLLAKGNCLRELRLANCENIDDNAFLALPPNMTFEHLRILDLTSCQRLTDAAVSKIIDAAPRLRNLVLAKCRNITDVSVTSISKLGKNLHYLHLGHCSQITDEGVKRLVTNCNRIRYIDLGCCTNLTDDSVKRLALLPKLKRIGLVKCSNITDASVNSLAEAAFRPRVRRDAAGVFIGGEYYASSLERVHLSYCVNLTLKSIIRLLNSCPRLTHLSLTGVAAFQRDDFQPFCRQAPAEFTQHQRDVFCVFSGGMVAAFRNFLNSAPEFVEIRDESRIGLLQRMRNLASRSAANANASAVPPPAAGGYDDEMGDDDDGGMLGVDGQSEGLADEPFTAGATLFHTSTPTINANTAFTNGNSQQHIPVPPPPPQPQHIQLQPLMPVQSPQFSFQSSFGALSYSSFINNQPSHGYPPLSSYGYDQASMASVRPPLQNAQQNPNNPRPDLGPIARPQSSTWLTQQQNGGASDGASTASMSRRPSDAGPDLNAAA